MEFITLSAFIFEHIFSRNNVHAHPTQNKIKTLIPIRRILASTINLCSPPKTPSLSLCAENQHTQVHHTHPFHPSPKMCTLRKYMHLHNSPFLCTAAIRFFWSMLFSICLFLCLPNRVFFVPFLCCSMCTHAAHSLQMINPFFHDRRNARAPTATAVRT